MRLSKRVMVWPFRHFGLKLLSVGLAVLLWMAVSGEETVERGLRVPLELQQFPSGLELQGEPPSTVDVRVRGASGALGSVSPGDIVAVLDLRTARAGRRLLWRFFPRRSNARFATCRFISETWRRIFRRSRFPPPSTSACAAIARRSAGRRPTTSPLTLTSAVSARAPTR